MEAARKLDEAEPIISFEKLLKNKISFKHLTYEEALEDIIKTATETRAAVNKALGVE